MVKKLFNRSDDQAEMSFVDHLEALRWHVVRSLAAVLVGAIVVFANIDFFFNDIILGPAHNDFITYKLICDFSHKVGMGDAMCMEDINLKLISTEMSSQFMMSFTIAFVAGFIIAFPYVFWEFWRFVGPALTPKEKKKTRGMIFWVSLLFFLGVGFGYFLLAPYTVNFFASFTLSPLIENNFRISDYIENITQLVLGTGVVFQLPLAVLFLSRVGILTPAFLRASRKYAVVVILVIAAVITPPDVVSQLIVTIPLWILYEISIGISARVVRDQEKKDKEWS
ncbi:twin-arginine translocase subunit TatC [Parasegetibacter sp. NRK P23]|uniref:twin-arginine translocase subunit TatC n=1 Tax=Parasegetibacter sp. NRK P23 TaxID=2942999 RepID=UPI00204366F4|nr:twin-arginine translocase subunit TatC [Parasegetibacter sp. NRK P23]MCM5529454.1 twin-arginine translocase subunit TatC [Parasegetibacter sp. NRK P23]